jgi:hypothetical protein
MGPTYAEAEQVGGPRSRSAWGASSTLLLSSSLASPYVHTLIAGPWRDAGVALWTGEVNFVG